MEQEILMPGIGRARMMQLLLDLLEIIRHCDRFPFGDMFRLVR